MPQLGLTMEEGAVTSWLKSPGEWVRKATFYLRWKPIKVEMEVESMGRGYLGQVRSPGANSTNWHANRNVE